MIDNLVDGGRKGGDAKTDECGGSSKGDNNNSCNGNGGKKGDGGSGLAGSGGAGYLTNGESVCGRITIEIPVDFKIEDCNVNVSNVLAQGGHAYVYGNEGGFIQIVDGNHPFIQIFDDDGGAPGGAGGFGGGGPGKY